MRPTPLFLILLTLGGVVSGKGRRPKRPQVKPTASAIEGTGEHRIRKGETAQQVARRYGLTLEGLKALNPSVNLARLSVGQRLKVRAGSKAVPDMMVSEGSEVAEDVVPRAVEPLAPLPPVPGVAPRALTHLERVLPSVPRRSSPELPSKEVSSTVLQALPMSSLASGPAPGVLEPVDREALNLLWPVETRTVSSAWGPRLRTRTVRVRATQAKRKRVVKVRFKGNHRGVDLTGPQGSSVFAALEGRVVEVGRHRQYGNYVVLDHGHGVTTLYAHNRVNCVRLGEEVVRGQKIAEVGRTGNATGPHLHFELRFDGVPQNPLPFLNDEEDLSADVLALNDLIQPSASAR